MLLLKLFLVSQFTHEHLILQNVEIYDIGTYIICKGQNTSQSFSFAKVCCYIFTLLTLWIFLLLQIKAGI